MVATNIWAKARSRKGILYFHIEEGTGDNLLKEDIDLGYVDYINYEYFDSMQAVYEENAYDGGMVLLKRYYQDMTLEEILKEVEEFEDVEFEDVEA